MPKVSTSSSPPGGGRCRKLKGPTSTCVFKNQDTSVAKAKKAVADYKKAVGQPEGLAELMVFFCERAVGFSNDVGLQDDSYFDALVRMFDQAFKAVGALPEERRQEPSVRLDAVRRLGHNLGYGVGDDMDNLLAEHGFDGGPHENPGSRDPRRPTGQPK